MLSPSYGFYLGQGAISDKIQKPVSHLERK